MGIDDSQLRKLSADLGKAGPTALARTRLVVQKTCADTKADAQVFAPVDTGNLRSSISYETHLTKAGATGVVGPTANYGQFVEDGTSRMPAQPYMGPAFDRRSALFVAAIEQLSDQAL